MIDSHAHLDMTGFRRRPRRRSLARARAAGVRTILLPHRYRLPAAGRSFWNLPPGTPRSRPRRVSIPIEAKIRSEVHAESVSALAAAGSIAAVGEIGLDYHCCPVSASRFSARPSGARSPWPERWPPGRHPQPRRRRRRPGAAVDAERFERGGDTSPKALPAAAMIERGFRFPSASWCKPLDPPPDRVSGNDSLLYLFPGAVSAEPAFVATARCRGATACPMPDSNRSWRESPGFWLRPARRTDASTIADIALRP